jgi:molybdopterin-guanine dinucleotide biosynthesis protein A
MGTDKALMQFEGCTLLERGLSVLKGTCAGVAIIGDRAKFANRGVAVIEDVYRDSGPLAGIHAALAQSPAELNLVLAVDMPFVTAALLEFLFRRAEGCDAVVTVPRIDRGFQPLCAIYRRSFAPFADEALRAGKYKIDALFPAATTEVIEEEELVAAGFSSRLFANLNTPHDVRGLTGDAFPS